MQVYLENFAKDKGMDPLLPTTWYRLAYEAIHQFQVYLSFFIRVWVCIHPTFYLFFEERQIGASEVQWKLL
jgi:hypothetical protein